LAAFEPTIDLLFQADHAMVQLINDFIQNHVFVEDEDDEMDDHTKIEELHKRRNHLVPIL
jgi:cohesin complex subunit SA-1/2